MDNHPVHNYELFENHIIKSNLLSENFSMSNFKKESKLRSHEG